ncbi:glycosyltransferase [Bacillus salacetis]|uniref:Glycosyltransferase n=1 Tax=Bacillus salacetis TaxID=2315464 RepID=A0A3A1R2V6_9BACI|nr:glycosyltransferase [Bacillus salacetis]RIW36056.1 glycosyltransferase [Bacillus salacetis]
MNILYISKLTGNMWAGPNNSVPAQISAQSKVDKVFWYNINHVTKDSWKELGFYNNLDDFPQKKIDALPYPFNKPDLVVFEGVYEFPFCSLVFEVWKKKIPYIIIPRSALTKHAQLNNRVKKNIGNLLFFNKFLNRAKSIHYLTEKEYLDSGDKWNPNYIVIPNGIEYKKNVKVSKAKQKLNGIYIGRIEIYQKGLDLLIEACAMIQDELRRANCSINLFGPNRNNSRENLQKRIETKGIKDLIFINEGVFGEEKEKIQIEADFFIMTSRFEGHPMGLIEALSYGLPSLVTTGTNLTDEIAKYDAGWTAETNTEGIVSALQNLLSTQMHLVDKGHNALELSKQYNWDSIAIITSNKYKDLINF